MIDTALILARAGELYGFSPAHANPLSGGHFSLIYEFPREGESFILRITPPNTEIDRSAMRAMLHWQSYLAEHGANVSTPLLSKKGSLIESTQLGDGLCILVAFKKVDGMLAEDLFPEQWNTDLTTALGQTVGRMHAISRRYHPDEVSLLRPAWDEIENCFNPSDTLDENHGWLDQKQQEIRSIIQSLPKDEGSYGLIHTDLHFANFMVNAAARRVTIIDFDDCAYGWYAMDLAMLLLDATVLETRPENAAHVRSFLKCFLLNYLREYQLDLYWIHRLPDFLKLLEIGLYTMLYQQYNTRDRTSWVGRFMAGRKERLENDTSYLEIDFVELADEITAAAGSMGLM